MGKIVRQLRAGIVLAAMWALLWGTVGGVLASIWYAAVGRTLGDTGGYFYVLRESVVSATWLGVLAGVLFAIALATFAREERLSLLKGPRVGLFGGVAGFAVAMIFPPAFVFISEINTGWAWLPLAALCTGLLSGGLSSWLTIAVATRAPEELPDSTARPSLELPG
jgi:hypothetical protein